MDIKRNKKKYSEKMFNELVLIYLISNTGYFFEYEAEFLLKISKRSIQRYVSEINETRVIGKHSKGLETVNENGYKSYHVHRDFFVRDEDPIEAANNPQSIILPIGFMQRHPAGLDSPDQHIVRLTRCALLLHRAKNAMRRDLRNTRIADERSAEIHFSEESILTCYDYYFNEMKFNVSFKTFKRDLALVSDVIEFMNNK
ncbi:MAG: hypothetical protein Q4E33_05535 [Erysipelotrichaceae bacterium]|nr:hypothetical protein [Erysipelotrichaceae bacterium]